MYDNILFDKRIEVNEHICINIPTVEEVLKNENEYFGIIALVTSTPSDLMVQLDDVGIDFTQISEWDLFVNLFDGLKDKDVSLVFGETKFSNFKKAINPKNGQLVLFDQETETVIDREIYKKMCMAIRKILCLKKPKKIKPANKEAKEYLIERARIKQNRAKSKPQKSQIEPFIIALVNSNEFPYNYETIKNITIYQFYASLNQVVKRVQYDKTMIGCYAGTVDMKNLKPDELSWIST